MVAFSTISGLGALSLLFSIIESVDGVSLKVSTDGGNSSSPLLYGFMFEDINHSGDGGIYGQMIQNNGLQGSSPNLTAWASVGDGTISVDTTNPLTAAIPNSLKLDIKPDATGAVGFTNEGYWGIPVDGTEFQNSFWMKGDFSGEITVRLVGNETGTEYGSTTFNQSSSSDDYTKVSVKFPTTKAPDGNVLYELTVDGESAQGSSLSFTLFELFAQTYKSRSNGLKPQLADALESVKGSFLRFPGGNNLEGNDVETRWKWNETIGPLENRPGHQGTWGYFNTDGLGLDEYLYWCEDMNLTPVLGVWAGFALESGGNTPITGDALTPYIEDVLNELEYVLGDPSTTYGKLRASYGREEPWNVTLVEIGNEDNLGGGCESYAERFTAFYNAIHDAYPDLTLIASTDNASCLPSPLPEGAWVDYHNYNTPDELVKQFGMFDNVDRSVPYFIGEYSRWEIPWPNMQGSVAEAVFMIGLERNSDVVKMAAYAPLLQLVNSTQWTPDLISFTQNPNMVIDSTSYYVQQMFSVNRGDTIKEVTSDSAFGPVYWVASSSGSSYYVKLANYGADTQEVSVSIPGMSSGKLTVLADSDPEAYNSDTQTLVTPSESNVQASNGQFSFTLPAWSVAVLTAN
ncbi:alpha-N-arabinofuranosidase A precursor [Aspergillus terreus NIH2624]|uniref:Probable alpha-L-arabinofuranosidase A n=1 Tax=Aspergillus terreus (strain NIH 2624 / FGSC A1156) TaxID=341663 RepID=ABFA_ASPTN|nr:alpha-N-arabinofuranosidase A precursor [Aspergillus terreus NIH2624]Q0CTV2.1 RecName: Full=Probable alpha-L-arabinofuranosidase A; Short=ABF A; Short=Arabinosidase A; Flags: Precursor [Aspergillus terreus NIH2624]EAU36156.1 alpha-N-arabinofuranosidase A precursor [Aspergillus terreus NIH2624]